MRIPKFMEPVTCVIHDYDGLIPLHKEGELVHSQNQPLIWWIDEDNPTPREFEASRG